MKRTRNMVAAATTALALGAAAPAPAQQPPIYLKLNEAIGLAFARNLDLKVELYNPALAEADIQRALGIYDPVLSASLAYTQTATPNTITFIPFSVKQYNSSVGVSQLLPTGGTVGASTDLGWVSNSSSYWSNDYNFTISQPLLKNLGREATELNIAVARVNKEGSVDRFRARLSDTAAQVRSDYFKFYFLRENLEVNKNALALAQKILEETKGRVNAGVLPAMEILSAQFSVSTREKAVIDAERALRDQMDVLRLELQLDPDREIVIVDQPTKECLQVAEPEALSVAMKNRPEVAAQLATIKVNDLQQKVARNRTLPDLNLNANVGSAGFDSRFTEANKKALKVNDPVWGIGLQFNYPIGNRAAENDYIRSKLTLEQSQAQLQSLQAGIANDVRSALRLLGASYKQIDVTARGKAYAEERLRSFRKRNAVGLATAKDVFDVENDLVTAEGNQIQALVDYNNAITQLWHVTGELLEHQGIKVSDRIADPLYQREK